MIEILPVYPHAPQQALIERAAEILRSGGLVSFPTETVYGLGANALNAEAVAKIYAAKGRPRNNPLIVHVDSLERIQDLVQTWPATAARLAERFWPGPLTLILPKADKIPALVTGGGQTVALRIPDHIVARALLQTVGLPVAAPSANRSTELSPTTAEHVLKGLGKCVDLILDGGPTRGGLESTVVDLSADRPCLLRPGLISPVALRQVLPELTIAPHVLAAQVNQQVNHQGGYQAIFNPAAGDSGSFAAISRNSKSDASEVPSAPLRSPGMQERHYSPRATLECWQHESWRRVGLCHAGQRVGWLKRPDSPLIRHTNLQTIEMPREVAEYSGRLYAALHDCDLAGLPYVVADLPPPEEMWLAVRDRLRRAATVWNAEVLPS
jgi:L-threonylcarbamoyladenylate synthase